MKDKWIKRFFPLVAVLLLAPWPVAYAYTFNADASGGQGAIQIEAADPSAAPSLSVFQGAIGGVDTPVDLFYIDATQNAADITATLYLANARELASRFRYLILRVGVYVKGDDGEWGRASGRDGRPVPDTFITLRNGQVGFSLPGYASYRVSIDGGSFYCTAVNSAAGDLSPQFYLDVE